MNRAPRLLGSIGGKGSGKQSFLNRDFAVWIASRSFIAGVILLLQDPLIAPPKQTQMDHTQQFNMQQQQQYTIGGQVLPPPPQQQQGQGQGQGQGPDQSTHGGTHVG